MIALPALLALGPVALSFLGRPARTWATSQLTSRNPLRYAAKNAFDGDRQTAWVEGAPGLGEGESLFLEFSKPVEVSGFLVVAGYARNATTLLENSAPSALELYADGKKVLAASVPWVLRYPGE